MIYSRPMIQTRVNEMILMAVGCPSGYCASRYCRSGFCVRKFSKA